MLLCSRKYMHSMVTMVLLQVSTIPTLFFCHISGGRELLSVWEVSRGVFDSRLSQTKDFNLVVELKCSTYKG